MENTLLGAVTKMDNIIRFGCSYRFAIYEHKVQRSNELSTIRMIVLKNKENRVVCYTGLEALSYPYTGQKPRISVRPKAELIYICEALNYLFGKGRVRRIADITAEMVFDFFVYYCTSPREGSDVIMRSQQSMDNCVRHVTSFFCNLADVYQTRIKVDDLMNYQFVKQNRNSRREVKKYIPRYDPKRPHSMEIKQLRDMPLAAATRLVELALIHDPMIAFGIVLELSAGLRPSCVCNMRQNDSPVSSAPCIKMSYIGSSVSAIDIDLRYEYVLRSDGVSVGRIKKERTVHVCKRYIPEIVQAYRHHMQLLSKYQCEREYKPMFLTRDGKAMTYATYSRRVKRLVYRYLKPELYDSEDPVLSAFAHLLDSRPWSPHSLRHCFTVRLVLDGYNVAQIQQYRGDSSPESALLYMNEKGDLERQVTTAHHNAIEGLSKLYGNIELQ